MNPRSPKTPEIPDYQLLKRIGQGSYGEVWLGRNMLDQYRALKIIYRDAFEDPRPYERELNGIRAFETVSRTHESQLDVLHVGQLNDGFYYVMELGDDVQSGPQIHPEHYQPLTLQHLLKQQDRLPLEECLSIVLALARALDHLHQNGLVHRDVKPSNVIFVKGRPKLADIGLVSPHRDTMTAVGTLGYVPTEGVGQVQGDIYALGKVLYEMATGRDRQAFPEWPTEAVNGKADAMFGELNEIMLKACEPDIKHRYPTARALLQDLEALQSGRSIRRVRALERRLRLARRFAGVSVALILVAVSAFFMQRKQTREVSQLLNQLSEKETQVRSHLQDLQIAHAVRLMDEEDVGGALLWAVEALSQETDPETITPQRLRVSSLLRSYPSLERIFIMESGIKHASFSADDQRVAAAGQDGTIKVWNLQSGQIVMQGKHEGMVDQITFSSDQRYVLTASHDKSAQLWDLASGKQALPAMIHEDEVHVATFSPDGQWIATASEDGTAKLWPVGQSKEGSTIALKHDYPVVMATFSPDSRFLMTGDQLQLQGIRQGRIHLWNTQNGAPAIPPIQHENVQTVGTFSPNGQWFAIPSQQNAVGVYWLVTGTPTQTIVRHQAAITAITFSPGSKVLATGSYDQTVRISDPVTGKLRYPPLRHEARVTSIAFSLDGHYFATTSLDGRARVWDTVSGHPLTPWILHGGNLLYTTFSHDGHRLLIPSSDGTLRIWKWRPSLLDQQKILKHDSPVAAIALNPSGEQLAGGTQHGEVQLWDAIEGDRLSLAIKHEGSISSLSFSEDGRWLASGSEDGHIQVWDTNKQQLHPFHASHADAVQRVSFDPQGKRLLSASTDHTAVIWDLETGNKLAVSHHEDAVNDAQWSRDGNRVATASDDSSVEIWEVQTGQPIGPYISHGNEVYTARFSPDGLSIVTASEARYLALFDATTTLQKGPLMRHKDSVTKAIFDSSGSWIASSSQDRTARLWDVSTGNPLTPPLEHSAAVTDLAFDSKGGLIATASRSGNARVWDVANGQPVTPVIHHHGPVRRVLFSGDARRLYTASQDGTIHIFPLTADSRSLEQLSREAQRVSGRKIRNGDAIPFIEPAVLLNNTKQSSTPDSPSSTDY